MPQVLRRLTIVEALDVVAAYTRGETESRAADELFAFEGAPGVKLRLPPSFDHGVVSRILSETVFGPMLAKPFAPPRVMVEVFEGDRQTQKAFAALPRRNRTQGEAMKLLLSGTGDPKALMAEYAGSVLIIVGHAETIDGQLFVRSDRDRRGRPAAEPDRIPFETLRAAADANGVQLIWLGCETGGVSAVGTSKKISSIDALRNIDATIRSAPQTWGAFLSGLAGAHYEVHMLWTAASVAYDPNGERNRVVTFEVVPRSVSGAGPNGCEDADSTDCITPLVISPLSAANLPVVPPAAPIYAAAYERSLFTIKWLWPIPALGILGCGVLMLMAILMGGLTLQSESHKPGEGVVRACFGLAAATAFVAWPALVLVPAGRPELLASAGPWLVFWVWASVVVATLVFLAAGLVLFFRTRADRPLAVAALAVLLVLTSSGPYRGWVLLGSEAGLLDARFLDRPFH